MRRIYPPRDRVRRAYRDPWTGCCWGELSKAKTLVRLCDTHFFVHDLRVGILTGLGGNDFHHPFRSEAVFLVSGLTDGAHSLAFHLSLNAEGGRGQPGNNSKISAFSQSCTPPDDDDLNRGFYGGPVVVTLWPPAR